MLDSKKTMTGSVSAFGEGIQATAQFPEILAPAGGMEQFFAAVNAGADAVFLGLKKFNARGRAGNFTLEELRQASKAANAAGVKILLTLNVVLKQEELPEVIDLLAEVATAGVHAVIVQDLGLVGLIRRFFPGLRIHASTQMAIHNHQGVTRAAELGISRVVVARELSFQELAVINKHARASGVELEAFCHGSLCYSYSGLCLFSGIEDSRSGNRGECAYTCRKPYRILNEPGFGFLFSMKDLSTYDSIDRFVAAGIHTLKIEGRKKDAQYVAAAVGLYRKRLSEAAVKLGISAAPSRSGDPRLAERDHQADLRLSYQRGETSFFLKGRYQENVIDLSNPTHAGIPLGTVERVADDGFFVRIAEGLEVHDGLRVDTAAGLFHAQPQHGSEVKADEAAAKGRYLNVPKQFAVSRLLVAGRPVTAAAAGDAVFIGLPQARDHAAAGDRVVKVRSNELLRTTHTAIKPPPNVRLTDRRELSLHIEIMKAQPNGPSASGADGAEAALRFCFSTAGGKAAEYGFRLPSEKPLDGPHDPRERLLEVFGTFGNAGFSCALTFSGEGLGQFFSKRELKRIKNEISGRLGPDIADFSASHRRRFQAEISAASHRPPSERAAGTPCYSVKTDQISLVREIFKFHAANPGNLFEVVIEPKRSMLHLTDMRRELTDAVNDCRAAGLKARLSLPTVLRAWDIPYAAKAIDWFDGAGGRAYEIGNLGALELLREELAPHRFADADIAADFMLYSLNSEAARLLQSQGVSKACLSIEDDFRNMSAALASWPAAGILPQAIIYKDTPLFIAESCSLTALHNGCPGPKTCGYRTLEIEDAEGERYEVAHEACRTIVYGKKAFSLSQHQGKLIGAGIREFRIDFLTRRYDADSFSEIMGLLLAREALPQTHAGNFQGQLL